MYLYFTLPVLVLYPPFEQEETPRWTRLRLMLLIWVRSLVWCVPFQLSKDLLLLLLFLFYWYIIDTKSYPAVEDGLLSPCDGTNQIISVGFRWWLWRLDHRMEHSITLLSQIALLQSGGVFGLIVLLNDGPTMCKPDVMACHCRIQFSPLNHCLFLVGIPQQWFLCSCLTIKARFTRPPKTADVDMCLQLEHCEAFVWALIWGVNLRFLRLMTDKVILCCRGNQAVNCVPT